MILQASTSRKPYTVITKLGMKRKDYFLSVRPQSSLSFDVTVNANTENNEKAFWKFSGLAKRNALESSVVLVGISIPDVAAEPIYENTYVEVEEEHTNGSIKFSVVGLETVSIKWTITIKAKET